MSDDVGALADDPPSATELAENMAAVVRRFREEWPPATEKVRRRDTVHDTFALMDSVLERDLYSGARDRALDAVLDFLAAAPGTGHVALEVATDGLMAQFSKVSAELVEAIFEYRDKRGSGNPPEGV